MHILLISDAVGEDDEQVEEHLFGKKSFDMEESFDTLITCKKCSAYTPKKYVILIFVAFAS